MHKYSERDKEVLELFRKLNTGPYNPPSYTCFREFVKSFPKATDTEHTASPVLPAPKWQPEPPYPRIYTDSYKKTLLSTL